MGIHKIVSITSIKICHLTLFLLAGKHRTSANADGLAFHTQNLVDAASRDFLPIVEEEEKITTFTESSKSSDFWKNEKFIIVSSTEKARRRVNDVSNDYNGFSGTPIGTFTLILSPVERTDIVDVDTLRRIIESALDSKFREKSYDQKNYYI